MSFGNDEYIEIQKWRKMACELTWHLFGIWHMGRRINLECLPVVSCRQEWVAMSSSLVVACAN